VAVDETSGLTFLELLGLRRTIKYIGSLQYITSGCIRALVDQGLAEPLQSAFGGNATLRAMQIASVDALIGGSSPNPDPKSFAFSSTADPGPLNRAEWIEFFALFFNKEYEASVLYDRTVSRYNCHKRAAQRRRTNEVVAWIAEYDFLTPTQYIISTSAYKKQFTQDAGGVLFEPSTTTFTDKASFLSAIADVDVIIDEDFVQDTSMATLETFCTKYGVSPCDSSSSLKFMQTEDVWRIDGLKSNNATGGNDWFESSIPEPDVVLEDLINALDPSINPSHNRTWLRNVNNNEAVVVESATCANVNATRVSRADACPIITASADVAQDWNVTYYETFKYVVNGRVNEQYVLHERGTDARPARQMFPNAKFFEIPLRSVAVDETSGLTFLELLGLRRTIKYIGSLQYITSGCIRALVDQGLAEPLQSAFGGNATLRAMQIASVDALIGGSSPNPDPKSFAFSSTADPGPLNRAEWIEFFALFFNKEYEASVLYDRTVSRYNCHKRAAQRRRTNEVVAWIAEYDFLTPTQYIISTSAYKKQFTQDAGGVLFEPSTTTFTDKASFLSAIADVDVIIDEDFVQDTSMATLETFCTKYGVSPCDSSSSLKFMQTEDVWRIDGLKSNNATGGNDWFESSIPEPDVVLEDLINALDPSINPSHNRTWLRNVNNNEAVVVESATCANVNATRVSRADECSASGVVIEPTATEISFTATFSNLDFNDIPAGFTSGLLNDLARIAFVTTSQVRIVSLLAGSVIARLAVDFDGDNVQARSFAAKLRQASGDGSPVFSAGFTSTFGSPVISPPAEVQGECESHILDNCGGQANCEVSDDECGFLEDRTDSWCDGNCYGGDCCKLNDGKVAGLAIGLFCAVVLVIGMCYCVIYKFLKRGDAKEHSSTGRSMVRLDSIENQKSDVEANKGSSVADKEAVGSSV